MSYEIKVPALGESIVEATVAKWLKREGDAVAAGEAVVELETDKVNLEVASDQAGVLGNILKGEGETVMIGDVLGSVAAGAAATIAATPAPLAEPAPAPLPAKEAAPAPAIEPTPTPSTPTTNGVSVAATPVAQRVAAEHALDLSGIPGSGAGGRVTKDDVLKAVVAPPSATSAATAVPTPAVAPTPTPAPIQIGRPFIMPPAPAPRAATPAISTAQGRPEERQRLSRRRLTIARRLVEAQQTAAMLTTFNEVDMSAVMDLRKRRKDSFKERNGISLGFMSFFTRATIGALKAYPIINAEIQGDEMVVKGYYDIGIAVGADEGLVVPVVRDADRKGFAALEREIGELAKKAREGTLSLAELQGGTFTITNGGVYGSLMSTPILNAPQVGILGMHKIEERPIVVSGQIVIRPMMYLAFSYDHRLIDGNTAVRFLVRIKELIEDPEALLLEG